MPWIEPIGVEISRLQVELKNDSVNTYTFKLYS
jgi:hypothetical protein